MCRARPPWEANAKLVPKDGLAKIQQTSAEFVTGKLYITIFFTEAIRLCINNLYNVLYTVSTQQCISTVI